MKSDEAFNSFIKKTEKDTILCKIGKQNDFLQETGAKYELI